MKKLFIYKEQNTNDRDCVKYVDADRRVFECGHYFTTIGLTGACFSQGLRLEEIDFDNITTILTREDFEKIAEFNKAINELGYGISVGDERYERGIELRKQVEPILEKLKSDENRKLFEEIMEEEIEYLMDEYSLDEYEVEYIFDNYGLDYRDRGVVGYIYDDAEDCGIEFAENCMDVPRQLEAYIDYEKLGRDLLADECYLELPDERVVYLNY